MARRGKLAMLDRKERAVYFILFFCCLAKVSKTQLKAF